MCRITLHEMFCAAPQCRACRTVITYRVRALQETEPMGDMRVYMWFMIRNWRMQLWSPRSHTDFKQETQESFKCSSSLSPKAWNTRRTKLQSECKRKRMSRLKNKLRSFFLPQPFILFGSSIQWMKPTHLEINLTQSADSNVNLIQKHPHRHAQKCFSKHLATPWPSQVHT